MKKIYNYKQILPQIKLKFIHDMGLLSIFSEHNNNNNLNNNMLLKLNSGSGLWEVWQRGWWAGCVGEWEACECECVQWGWGEGEGG